MDADEVLATKKYLRAIGEWPSAEKIDAKKWLTSFAADHQKYAVALLDSFVFISDRQVVKLFTNTIHSISEEISRPGITYADKRALWRDFLRTATFSAPTGEEPSPADSGHIFLRLARTDIGVDEHQIKADTALRGVVESNNRVPIIFVDDFAGSGNQFLETWNRTLWPDAPQTIAELSTMYNLTVYYAPLVCTDYAAKRLSQSAPSVRVRAAHVLTDVYCATDPNTIVFPDHLRAGVNMFIEEASKQAGIARWKDGFHHLALDLAFEHQIPDACVAVLWSEEGGWVPLMAKK